MFLKIAITALMTIIVCSEGEDVWDGLSAKWAADPADGFYHLPQSLQAAECQGWTEISGVGTPKNVKALGYYGDPRIVLLFSLYTGEVLGHQIGILVTDIEEAGVPINYSENPAITKKMLNGEEYFTATALYYRDEQEGTRQIWLEVDGEFVEIPTKPELAIGNSSAAHKRTWFESIPPGQLQFTIPDAPACIGEGVAKYGVISFHVWFRKNPVNIVCENECTAVFNSTRGRGHPQDRSGKRYKRALGSANVCPV